MDILGIRIVEALAGGSGPGPFSLEGGPEPRPFFESEYPNWEEAQKAGEEAKAKGEERQAEAFGQRKKNGREGASDQVENGDEESRELESHTVEELREIADKEDIDLTGADRKAEIVKAIKTNRKNRQ
jgi:hypothetical protein